jgi:probable F420-dependent oxidoreductase
VIRPPAPRSVEVIDDISAFVISGRVHSSPPADPLTGRSVGQGVDDGIEAERLGFGKVFLSERYNIKEFGVVMSTIAARTSRLGLGTGVMSVRSRHPLLTAAIGATMHALHGPRFVLGIGRSDPVWIAGADRSPVSYAELVDYADIVTRLWTGETVTYDGPAGSYQALALGDLYDGPPPQIWTGSIGGPLAARASAAAPFDGAMLMPMMTPDATYSAVTRLRAECERAGRDPQTLRIAQPVVTAPEMSELETLALANARLVTYITWPGYAETFAAANGWDVDVLQVVASHPMFRHMVAPSADLSFHREQLLEPARLIPDSWMQDCCAIGSVDECVKKLQQFRDAGADEIITYGSTPGDNAALLDAWRDRR